MIKAFIFDLDGVITDTAEYHFLAWKELANEIGIDFDRSFNEQLKGVSRLESLELILKHGGREHQYNKEELLALATKKNDHYKQLIKRITPNHYLEGTKELLEELKTGGFRIGLASASRNAPTIIDRLAANNYIEYIANPEEVQHGKPAPDLFLDVANRFEVMPSECIGIEDAKAGIEAINRAGMFSVGVGTKASMKEADLIVGSTKELNLQMLLEHANEK